MTGGTLLDTYLASVKELQQTKASIGMLESRIRETQRAYSAYEPAGVNLKRIEREVTIAEQEYLEQLHGLNLAKLKVQDVELSSNIKAVDPPYFPVKPDSTKRLMQIVAAAVFGFLLVFFTALGLEYFDATLRNPQKASRILHLQPAGVYPKINGNTYKGALPMITNRLIEMIIQQIELYPPGKIYHQKPRTILFFSTQDKEGKTVILGNIARKLKQQGKKVITINFSGEALLQSEANRMQEDLGKKAAQEISLKKSKNQALALRPPEEPGEEQAPVSSVSLEIPETTGSSEGHMIFKVDESYYAIRNYADLLHQNPFVSSMTPDYVLIELPPLLHHPYPAGLVSSSDVTIMVCRSNRSWSEADQGALVTFMKLSRNNPLFLLNGVEAQVVKATIGTLPKKNRAERVKTKKKNRV